MNARDNERTIDATLLAAGGAITTEDCRDYYRQKRAGRFMRAVKRGLQWLAFAAFMVGAGWVALVVLPS